jgi:hypothetical protein
MALALVTTPGPTANAYAEQAVVVALAAYRGAPGRVFLDLSSDEQMAAIAAAAAELDSFVVPAATLAGATTFPPAMVRANEELAITRAPLFTETATADPLVPVTNTIKRDKTGPLETEYFAPPTVDPAAVQALPPIVQRLIDRWLKRPVPMAAAGYGSSTAVRGA